ncbi:MAG: hypothetical protein UMV23_01900 [Halanaerobium sp.]|nr:hypothetical protein [Halanaerobium sp.]
MLTIKCAKCKTKLFKYEKIGMGRILRCWKEKITRLYDCETKEDFLLCSYCGNVIGELEDDYLKMNGDAFTYSGKKVRR